MSSALPDPKHLFFGELEKALSSCENRIEEMNGGALGKQFRQELQNRLQRDKTRVLSLDIFDTLLLRNDVCEAQRYFDISSNISRALARTVRVSPLDLYISRCEAMKFCYRTSVEVGGCIEGRLENVIENQIRSLRLPKTTAKIFLREEIRYELSVLVPNNSLIEQARAHAENGGIVLLISDMYLSGDRISTLIEKTAGKLTFVARLISSADVSLNKRSGKVFTWLKKDLNIPSQDFLHIGDNFISDYQRPIEAGWRAMHFPVSQREHMRREKSLEQFTEQMTQHGITVSRWVTS